MRIFYFRGKIRYYTVPPEDKESDVHLGAKIITEVGKEFDIDSFETMEAETLTRLEAKNKQIISLVVESSGPVTLLEEEKMDTTKIGDDNLVNFLYKLYFVTTQNILNP